MKTLSKLTIDELDKALATDIALFCCGLEEKVGMGKIVRELRSRNANVVVERYELDLLQLAPECL